MNRVVAARWRLHVCALAAYLAIAVVFAWPLPRHLGTHLTGAPDGDAGVYVWNLWVFQHEILEHRTVPYFTDTIFAGSGRRANLSLHNYTAFANIVALPFVRSFGVVPTFNAIYLFLTLLSAYTMFLLARRLVGGDAAVAWLAGALFAWSPILVTRGMGHFSLVAAAPLPIFVLLLLRLHEGPSLRTTLGLGVTVAWATACDVYYGVYCLMMLTAYLMAIALRLKRLEATPARQVVVSSLDILAVCVAGLVVALLVSHGWQFTFLGRVVRIRTVYTPLLILAVLGVVRVALHYRPAVRPLTGQRFGAAVRVVVGAGVVSALLMSPLLFAVGERFRDGSFVRPKIFWRSSPPGIDLLAWIAPNPNHPLAPPALREWLGQLTRDGYLENVASVSFVALAVIVVAWRTGWRAPGLGLGLAIGFGMLALGPFVRIAGMDTHVPGPWALLRYVPIVDLLRSPGRFAVVATMGLAIVFGQALRALVVRWSAARRPILAFTAVLLMAELLPAPLALHSAAIPSIYRIVAADPSENARVLELPFGVSDGTMTVGRFTSRSQFYQTAHGKPILGGYLSRVSRRRIADTQRDPLLKALIALSEGNPLSAAETEAFGRQWPEFARRASIGYVVVDEARAPPALRTLVATTLRLQRIAGDGDLQLYRP